MTLQEIAARANVSIATVSRTINGVPTVRPAVARRVRKVIEQIGYYPNTQARALVHGRSRIFGLMVSDIISRYFPEIAQRFADLGIEHSYEILLTPLPEDPARLEVAARRLIERRVDGVAIFTFRQHPSLIDAFRRQKVSLFAIEHKSPGPLLKTVRVDYRHGIRQAVQHLAALGHVRIAFISGPKDFDAAVARKVAFQECMREIDLAISPNLLVDGDHTVEAGMKSMSLLMSLRDRPSAVVCSNDVTTIGAMQAACVLGLNVPRDLSLVGIDDAHFSRFTTPPLTTIQISQVEIADIAFASLRESVEPKGSRPSREVRAIQTNLVLRGSTSLAPERAKERVRTPCANELLRTERTPRENRSEPVPL